MDILKIVFTGIITALLCSVVRQVRPEMTVLTALAGILIMCGEIAASTVTLTGEAEKLTALSGLNGENTEILVKVTALCAVTRLGADICNDNSCTAAGAALEISGRLGALLVALPMIKAAASAAVGLLNS